MVLLVRHHIRLPALLPLLALVLAACGLSSVRRAQDWSQVTDPRFRLVCHVGNWGSGVLVDCDATGANVLTCAHLVEEGETVTLSFQNAARAGWVAYDGRVVRRSHPHKQDLALVRVDTKAFHLAPTTLAVADGFAPGAEGVVQVFNIAFGAEKEPFLLDLPAVGSVNSVTSNIPDASGATRWQIDQVVVHGGITQANSGSPVFDGDRLVGLVESAPAGARTPKGGMVLGVAVTAPSVVRAFLETARTR